MPIFRISSTISPVMGPPQPSNSMYPFFYCSESDHCFYVAWYGKYNLQLHDYTHTYDQEASHKSMRLFVPYILHGRTPQLVPW